MWSPSQIHAIAVLLVACFWRSSRRLLSPRSYILRSSPSFIVGGASTMTSHNGEVGAWIVRGYEWSTCTNFVFTNREMNVGCRHDHQLAFPRLILYDTFPNLFSPCSSPSWVELYLAAVWLSPVANTFDQQRTCAWGRGVAVSISFNHMTVRNLFSLCVRTWYRHQFFSIMSGSAILGEVCYTHVEWILDFANSS